MKCDGCGAETSATYTTDTSGLMLVWCAECTAKRPVHATELDTRLADMTAQRDALRAALREALDLYALADCDVTDEVTARVRELCKLAEGA